MLSDVQCILNVPPSWSFLNGLFNHVVKELNVEEALKSSILVVQKAVAFPLSWYFLNGLLNHVIKELNVEEVLKSSIFVVQKAAAPKNGVEFRQGSNGSIRIRSSLATSCEVSRRRARSPNFDQSEALKLSQTDRYTHRESTYCQALLYEQRLQKVQRGK